MQQTLIDGKEYVLVHDDGCGETPLEGFYCPKCGFPPDMQSTAFLAIERVKPYIPPGRVMFEAAGEHVDRPHS